MHVSEQCAWFGTRITIWPLLEWGGGGGVCMLLSRTGPKGFNGNWTKCLCHGKSLKWLVTFMAVYKLSFLSAIVLKTWNKTWKFSTWEIRHIIMLGIKLRNTWKFSIKSIEIFLLEKNYVRQFWNIFILLLFDILNFS